VKKALTARREGDAKAMCAAVALILGRVLVGASLGCGVLKRSGGDGEVRREGKGREGPGRKAEWRKEREERKDKGRATDDGPLHTPVFPDR